MCKEGVAPTIRRQDTGSCRGSGTSGLGTDGRRGDTRSIGLATTSYAISVADRVRLVVEAQDTLARVVTVLVNEMDGHTAADGASMSDKRVRKRADLLQSESTVLWEETDAAGAEIAVQAEGGVGRTVRYA